MAESSLKEEEPAYTVEERTFFLNEVGEPGERSQNMGVALETMRSRSCVNRIDPRTKWKLIKRDEGCLCRFLGSDHSFILLQQLRFRVDPVIDETEPRGRFCGSWFHAGVEPGTGAQGSKFTWQHGNRTSTRSSVNTCGSNRTRLCSLPFIWK